MATKQIMSSSSSKSILTHAKISPYHASRRAHVDAGWLLSDRSFNVRDYYSPSFEHFGKFPLLRVIRENCPDFFERSTSFRLGFLVVPEVRLGSRIIANHTVYVGPIRVLNEDRVAPQSGFPTHPHRDAEIFSYILNGELTHRDSTLGGKGQSQDKKLFYRMKRGDVQFTSAGTGVTHSENNEHGSEWVHFLQIWVLPWTKGLKPSYHTESFSDEEKRKGFVTIISPVKGCVNAASSETETACIEGTIPIHADFWFGAAIVPVGEKRAWRVAGSGGVVKFKSDRKMYVYLPQMKAGKARIRLNGSEDAVLEEGDGAFVSSVNAGDELVFESVGTEEAEVVVLDANPI
jgi:redox-sensitive bicupin YhaK (pirin superfamily)